MAKKPDNSPQAKLRRRAEAKLRGRKSKTGPLPVTEVDARHLVHELQVHQIELEMQNEELVRSRAQVEAGLRQYTDLYDFAPVGYFTLRRDGAIPQVNLAGANLLGVERGKLIGRRLGLFVSAHSRITFNKFLDKVFRGRQKEACEVALQDNGAAPVWVRIEAISDAWGSEYEVCRAVVSDITDRKQAEQAEHAARELAEALRDTAVALNASLNLDAVLDQILISVERVIPHDGANIMLVNGDLAQVARVSGRCTPQSIGAEQHTITTTDNLRTMRDTGEPCIFDYTRIASTWRTLPDLEWIASYAGVPIGAQGKLLGYLGLYSAQPGCFSAEHIEPLKVFASQVALAIQNAQLHARIQLFAEELEERVADRTRQLSEANVHLTELDRLRDDFISRISHELLTPLVNIKLYLGLLDHGKPEKHEQYIATLLREVARLQQLIEDLLHVSQLELEAARLQLVPIDVNQLLAQLVIDRSELARERGLQIESPLTPDLPRAAANSTLLMQALSYLMSNAINYTPAGGTLTLSTALQPGDERAWVICTVRDTGPSISAKDRPHIFERFYRGEAAKDYKIPGTGLGLAISKEIVEKMGGRITVESEPDHGAAFTVWLKLAD